jgi:hypothetical protein
MLGPSRKGEASMNADVAAPFMSEFYAFETGKH